MGTQIVKKVKVIPEPKSEIIFCQMGSPHDFIKRTLWTHIVWIFQLFFGNITYVPCKRYFKQQQFSRENVTIKFVRNSWMKMDCYNFQMLFSFNIEFSISIRIFFTTEIATNKKTILVFIS